MMTNPAPVCSIAVLPVPAGSSFSAMVRAAGEHGGDGAAVARSLGLDPASVLDLSASLNPFAPDVAALVGDVPASTFNAYPDASAGTELLAAHVGVSADRVVLTNGGAEAIALVAALLGDGLVDDPDFSLYRRHLRSGDDPSGGRWRSNPSSPLGLLAGPDETATVWDEAFWPMTMGSWTRGDDAAWRIGSLTKLWSCPGIRLGHVIAPDAASAARIRGSQPRWSVNGLALALLPTLLGREDLPATAARIGRHRALLAAAVADLGFDVMDGVAPWLLLPSTPGLRAALAPLGIVVRDCGSFGLPDVHRIGLPAPRDVDRVLTALATVAPRVPTTVAEVSSA
ncbi:MAG: putative threonine-phosphate decarboxylase [Ilumatobacteraceae bacterium]|nr:putative threonine-phosphate decarboxylase [Ilumatobacteraceae bacterium]